MDRERRIAWGPIRVGVRIPGFVLPSLKVHGLGWAYTQDDPQNFGVGYSLSKTRIEAGAALLNKAKVEARRKGNRIDQVRVVRIGIGSGNCRMLSYVQTRDGLSE